MNVVCFWEAPCPETSIRIDVCTPFGERSISRSTAPMCFSRCPSNKEVWTWFDCVWHHSTLETNECECFYNPFQSCHNLKEKQRYPGGAIEFKSICGHRRLIARLLHLNLVKNYSCRYFTSPTSWDKVKQMVFLSSDFPVVHLSDVQCFLRLQLRNG